MRSLMIVGMLISSLMAAQPVSKGTRTVVENTVVADTTVTIKIDTIRTVTYDTIRVTKTLKDTALVTKTVVDTIKAKSLKK